MWNSFLLFAAEHPVASIGIMSIAVGIVFGVAGSISAAILNYLTQLLEKITSVIFSSLYHSLVTTITVTNSSFHENLEIWLHGPGDLIWRNHVYDSDAIDIDDVEEDINEDDFEMKLGNGSRVMVRFKRWMLMISKPSDKDQPKKRDSQTIQISTLFRNRRYLEEFMTEVAIVGQDRYKYIKPSRNLRIFVAGEYWRLQKSPARPMDSVFLPDETENMVIDTIQEFMDSREWYLRMCLPHRMGIMLTGPPGSGKTSLVKALASHFFCDLHVVPLGSPYLDDDQLLELFSELGNRITFVLMEDLSALQLGTQVEGMNDDEGSQQRITLSGLLNGIDGAMSPEHVIFVYTANTSEHMDKALTRHGRVDVVVDFKLATSDQAGRIFDRFFPDHPELSQAWKEAIPDHIYSMAHLQFVLQTHKNDPEKAVQWAISDDTDPPVTDPLVIV